MNSETEDDDYSRPTPVDGWFTPQRIASCIRNGGLPSDRLFDRLLPPEFQRPSQNYWTPLRIALRAADWLEEYGVQSVLDIGSGVGKFCVLAALRCRAHFLGIEHRQSLVVAARDLANTFALTDRVEFVHDMFGRARPPRAGAYYLFNPFGENLYRTANRLDDNVETSRARFVRDVWAVQRLLHAAPDGTWLITYNGYGGSIPPGYELVREAGQLASLKLWRKRAAHQSAPSRSA